MESINENTGDSSNSPQILEEEKSDMPVVQKYESILQLDENNNIQQDVSDEYIDNTIKERVVRLYIGKTVKGKVLKINNGSIILDISYKSEAIMFSNHYGISHTDINNFLNTITIGSEVEVLIMAFEYNGMYVLVSRKEFETRKLWDNFTLIKNQNKNCVGVVIEVVKGGLIVDIGIRAFLPSSLIERYKVQDLNLYLGKEVQCKIIDINKSNDSVIISRRAYLEEFNKANREKIIENIKRGNILTGTVSYILPFGAFVDLGGIDGLIHISQLTWSHINHPSEVVTVGDTVTVEVLDYAEDYKRLSLSLKSFQEDPWQVFIRDNTIGNLITGKLAKVVQYGLIIKLNKFLEGFVHVSEILNRQHVNTETFESIGINIGMQFVVKILDIDIDKYKIGLSIVKANKELDKDANDEYICDLSKYDSYFELDENGQYKMPEGYDVENQQWLPGYESKRSEWENHYTEARKMFELHVQQVEFFKNLSINKESHE